MFISVIYDKKRILPPKVLEKQMLSYSPVKVMRKRTQILLFGGAWEGEQLLQIKSSVSSSKVQS